MSSLPLHMVLASTIVCALYSCQRAEHLQALCEKRTLVALCTTLHKSVNRTSQ